MSRLQLKSPFKERTPTPVEVSWTRLVRASMRAVHVTNEGSHYDAPLVERVHRELDNARAEHFCNLQGAP